MSLSSEQLVEVLRGAGEPSRLRILALLAREELAVMELSQVLDQSQPRVSRHLKLLAEAGLVERFPDGAWVFYRLTSDGPAAALVAQVLGAVDTGEYFARNAARWDEIRSLYVSDADVEAAILAAAGPGPFKRLVDLGSGTGRMLTLLAPHAEAALGLDLSQQMLNLARNRVTEAGLQG